MKTYHLYEQPDGRVVLNKDKPKKEDRPIREIKADSWKEARAKIKDLEFFHDPGHGYFETPRPGAYKRATETAEREVHDALRLSRLIRENDMDKRGGSTTQKNYKRGAAIHL